MKNKINENVVVYTGSFCPPTKAHFALMEKAIEAVDASRGIFLPTCDEHIKKKLIKKMDPLSLSGDVRIKMLETFCKKREDVEVCDYEIKVKDSDSTYKTFSYLQKEYPSSTIYYVMGADKLKNLPHWKNCDKFLNEFKFIVFDRADMNSLELIEKDSLLKNYKDNFVIVPPVDDLSFVSSSKVRKMFLDHDENYKNYLSEEVVEILENLDIYDYPPVTDYDYIRLMLRQGPHGMTSACRRVYLANKKFFEDNEYFRRFKYIKLIDKVDEKFMIRKYHTEIVYEYIDLIDLADDKTLIISECSSNRVGHNYDQGGHDSMEEELCKTSNLSQALYCFGNPKLKCVKEFGGFIENIYPLKDPLLVEGVKIFRRDKYRDYYFEFFDKSTNVMMVPSLNLKRSDKINDLNYLDGEYLNEEGMKIMENNLRKALLGALAHGYKTLIINYFGTGFHVPYYDSVDILEDMIHEFRGCFKRIFIIDPKHRGMKLGKY